MSAQQNNDIPPAPEASEAPETLPSEEQRPAPLRIRVAVKQREIHYGWELMDYIRSAVQSRGWENIGIWGKKGSGKSNLALQILYDAYQNWDEVFKHLIFTHEDFISWLEVMRSGNRIPLLVWDDINAYLPRTLYYSNRGVYEVISRSWEVIREGLSVFIWTAPRKENVSQIILRDMTMDVQAFGRTQVNFAGEQVEYSHYEVRRWFILQDKHGPERERKAWVMVETSPSAPQISHRGIRHPTAHPGVFLIRPTSIPCYLRYCGVPEPVWERYWREKRKVMEAEISRWERNIVEYEINEMSVPEEEVQKVEGVEGVGWSVTPSIASRRRARSRRPPRIPADEFEPEPDAPDGDSDV
mgnify:CR=1 FL=1